MVKGDRFEEEKNVTSLSQLYLPTLLYMLVVYSVHYTPEFCGSVNNPQEKARFCRWVLSGTAFLEDLGV